MNYTIDVKTLKSRGYNFQKLYLFNYKFYHKQMLKTSRSDIWVRISGKAIEVNDWYHLTETVIKFYLENRNKQDHHFFVERNDCIVIQMNPKDGMIRFQNGHKAEPSWYNSVILFHETMKPIIDELCYLTGRDLWSEYPAKIN